MAEGWAGASVGSSEAGTGGANEGEISLAQMGLVNVAATRWMADGKCRQPGMDPEWWYREPPQGNYNSDRVWSEAKAICATCPVMANCLAYALEQNEPWGVWGGLGPLERADLLLRKGVSISELRIGDRKMRKRHRPTGAVSNKDKTHCNAGHEFTPETTRINVLVEKGRRYERRSCMICEAERKERRRERERMARRLQKAEKEGRLEEQRAIVAELARRVVEKVEADRAALTIEEQCARAEKAQRKIAELRKAAERMRNNPDSWRRSNAKRILARARKAQEEGRTLTPEGVKALEEAGELKPGYVMGRGGKKPKNG
jgi:WhiB family redox-sensing transcriptional regulator